MQYSSITSSFATYADVKNSYDSYNDLIDGLLGNSKYGEYELQVFKYQPLAYWRVNEYSSATENSIFNSSAAMTKNLNASVYKPIVYSLPMGTTAINASSGLSIASGQLKLGSSTYDKQPFSINFWYKNLDNTFYENLPIFSFGYYVNLYIKSGTFYLNFLGQKIYVEMSDFTDTYNISITFDGSKANLIVNGKSGISTFSITEQFDASPSMIWLANSDTYCIIQSVAVFGYAMSETQCKYLYEIGSLKNSSEQVFSASPSYTLDYNITQYNQTLEYIPNDNNAILRNCLFDNGTFYLPQKPFAVNNGAYAVLGAYEFNTATANISVPITSRDFDLNNCAIQVNSVASGESGTLLYIEGSKNIKVVLSSGIVNVYSSDSTSPIYTGSGITEGSVIRIIFSDGTIRIGEILNSQYTETNTGYSTPSNISSFKIGNNENNSDVYSGTVSKFIIDYVDYPLPDGIYTLELDNATNGITHISPRYGGVALAQIIMKSGTTGNYINFKSSGGSRVQQFTNSNTMADYFACQNGTSLSDNSRIITTSITEDTVVPIAIYLYSNGDSMSTDLDMPKIKDIKISGYSDKTLYVKEISATTASSSVRPYNILDKSIYVHESFSITNTNYNVKDIFFKIKFKSTPTSGTLLSIGSTGITLNGSQILQAITGSTLTVNSGFPQQFKINEDIYVRLSLNSAQPLDVTFYKSNYYLSDLVFLNTSGNYFDYTAARFFDYEFRNNIEYVIDPSTVSLTDSIIAKAFTSNIIFSG